MRLLVINWQDLRNPQAGGAEIHLHEIFGRLARRGHHVTLLCGGWPGAPKRERVDDLDVHRIGGRYSFALHARPYYRKHLRDGGYDLIVEDINKIPLYAPWWARPPVVALIPHLFGTTAFREAGIPLAAAVWTAELLIPRAYRRAPFQAISESTADDLARRGIARDRIRVIRPGIDHVRFRPDPAVPRFPEPTFVYIGRLKRYKGMERVIDAIGRLRSRDARVRLVIAGKGDHEADLRAHAAERGAGGIEFRGYITEEEKLELLRRAWATVYPSPKEGWGITNIEAAACGTPAVASDSPGLRESVSDGESGLLVAHDDVRAWIAALERLVADAELRRALGDGARSFARQFSWDRAADRTESHLLEIGAARASRPVEYERVSGTEV